jgi:hypothetical protein
MGRVPVIAYQGDDEKFDIKLYYQVNKEKIKEQRIIKKHCEYCNRYYNKASFTVHSRTDKHLKNKRHIENCL